MTIHPPYAVPFDLGGLSDRSVDLSIEPGAKERQSIAEWLGVMSVDALTAGVRLTRLGDERYRYEAQFSADVVQACVVTLAPVPSHLAAEFSREFRMEERSSARKMPAARSRAFANLDEEEVEALQGSVLDLAAPVLEELSLALDPYPRAPGAAFEPAREEKSAAESPFAVLAKLKQKPGRVARNGHKGGGKGRKKGARPAENRDD